MNNYLNEAFKSLDILSEKAFSITDNGLADAKTFIDSDIDDEMDELEIIDTEASSVEELCDDYVGKIILDCDVCHSKVYKDKDAIEVSDEGEFTTANAGQECPYCLSTDGFHIIGEVKEYSATEVEVDGEDVPVDNPDEKEPEKEDGKESVKEAVESPRAINKQFACGAKVKKVTRKMNEVRKDRAPHTATGNVEEGLDEGIFGFGKKKNSSTPDKSGKHDAAYAKAMEKTPVVVKFWRDGSHKPEIVDYFDSNLAAEGVVKRHQNDVDKSVNYRYMTAKEAERAGAFVSLPSKFVNKYLGESVEDDEVKKLIKDTLSKNGVSANADKVTDELATLLSQKNESFDSLKITTGDEIINVTTEPNTEAPADTGEILGEIDDATKDEILAPEEPEEGTASDVEIPEGEAGDEVDVTVDEIQEESFDRLSESYLKKTYENVLSYKTTKAITTDKGIILEGKIKFTSGKVKPTKFVFENCQITRAGKVRFIGENTQLSRGKKSFTVSGRISNKSLVCESLRYNYQVMTEGKKNKVYGTVYNK